MPVKPDHLASSTPHTGAQRKEKRDIASKHLSHCIAVLEELVDTYDPDTEGSIQCMPSSHWCREHEATA